MNQQDEERLRKDPFALIDIGVGEARFQPMTGLRYCPRCMGYCHFDHCNYCGWVRQAMQAERQKP